MHYKKLVVSHLTLRAVCALSLFFLSGMASAQVFDNVYSADENLQVGEYNQRMMMHTNGANFLAGTAEDEFGFNSIPFAMKTDLNGNVLWSKKYEAGANSLRPEVVERSHDGNDFVIMCDRTDPGATSTTIFKVSGADGSVIWAHNFNVFNMRVLQKHRINQQDVYVVAGEHVIMNSIGNYIKKTRAFAFADPSGAIIWSKEYREGTLTEDDTFFQAVTGFHPHNSFLGITGKYYLSSAPGVRDKYVMLMGINMNDGSVFANSVNYYNLEWLPGDMGIETDAPFTWDVTPITVNGQLDGYALSGSYVFDNLDGLNGSGPCVLRLNLDRTPAWAKLYHNGLISTRAHARKDFEFGNLLRVATLHQVSARYQPGYLTVNKNTGDLVRFRYYENGDAVSIRDGSMEQKRNALIPGHVFWQDLDNSAGTLDEDIRIISVRSGGSGSDCQVLDTLNVHDLEIEHYVNEMGFPDITTTVSPDVLEVIDLPLTVTPCSEAGKRPEAAGVVVLDQDMETFQNPIPAHLNFWQLRLRTPLAGRVNIRVIDALGNVILTTQRTARSGEQTWSFSAVGMAAGMYLVQVRQGDLPLLQDRLVRQ